MPPKTNNINHKTEIENAAKIAVKVISDAAGVASDRVAQAASDAARVVADAAAVSVKVLSVKNADDHDLLIILQTKMDGLKEDIRDLKSGTSQMLQDHELRLKKVEGKVGMYVTTITLTGIAIGALFTIILYHIFR